MNSDFKELLLAVVGGYAVMAYTEPRYTKDLDVWVRAEAANADRVFRSLAHFGAPLDDVAVDFPSHRARQTTPFHQNIAIDDHYRDGTRDWRRRRVASRAPNRNRAGTEEERGSSSGAPPAIALMASVPTKGSVAAMLAK